MENGTRFCQCLVIRPVTMKLCENKVNDVVLVSLLKTFDIFQPSCSNYLGCALDKPQTYYWMTWNKMYLWTNFGGWGSNFLLFLLFFFAVQDFQYPHKKYRYISTRILILTFKLLKWYQALKIICPKWRNVTKGSTSSCKCWHGYCCVEIITNWDRVRC